MSHYTAIRTKLADLDSLVKALAEVGYGEVEVYDEPQRLYGYLGDRRSQTGSESWQTTGERDPAGSRVRSS